MILQLVALSAFLLILASLIKNDKYRLPMAVLCAGFIGLESASFFMTSEPLNFTVIHHLGLRNLTRTFKAFQWWWTVFIILGLVFLIAFWRISGFKRLRAIWNRKPAAALLLLSLAAVMSLPGGILYSLKTVLSEWSAVRQTMGLPQAMEEAGLNPAVYLPPERIEIHADQTRNIVVISLESFEKAFLNRPDLTPHLNSLAKTWTYFDNFTPVEGTFPTVAALYSWQTGLPFLFGVGGNDVFKNSRAVPRHLPSLPLILKKAGYSLHYLAVMTDFAGMESMMGALGYDSIKGRKREDYPFEVINSYYDFYDRDVLALAKLEFSKLHEGKKPFLLVVSTIDTHFPGELYDPRIDKEMPPNSGGKTERLIQWTDLIVADLVAHIEALDKETVIIIMPDHLSFQLPQGFDRPKPGLYLLANKPASSFGQKAEAQIIHPRIPAMILKAAGVETNFIFPADLITGDFKTWTANNREGLISLNRAFWAEDQ